MQREEKLFKTVIKYTDKMFLLPEDDDEKLLDYIKKEYKIPPSIIKDMINRRRFYDEKAGTADIDYLFALLDGIDHIAGTKLVDTYFEPREVKEHKKYDYTKVKRNDLGLEKGIEALEVAQDQYIIVKNVEFLMKLRKNSMLIYNAETQRPLRKRIHGNTVSYEVFLSLSACKSIQKRYEEQKFIPNLITLNVMLEDNPDFDMKYSDGKLKLYNLNHFDILDGYHRFYALCNAYDNDNSFDYPVILQITIFNEDRAKSFIFQEDHKTKMRRVDAATYSEDTENKIVDALSREEDFPWRGKIRRNGGTVDFADLTACVKYFYLQDVQKSLNLPERNKIKKEIKDAFIRVMEINGDLFEKKQRWNRIELALLFYMIKNNKDEQILNFENYASKIDKKAIVFKTKNIQKKYVESLIRMCDLG